MARQKPHVYRLTDKDGFVALSQVVGPKWASPEFYIGRVREEYGAKFTAASDLYDICFGILCCPKEKAGKHTTKFTLTDAHIKMLNEAVAKYEAN